MAVTSSGSGDWSSVISGGLSVNDDVIINHDVTLDGNATDVNSLIINSGKTLTGGGNTITIDSRDSATGLSIDINGSTSGELNINITNNLNNDIGIGTDKVHDLTINNDTDARINYCTENTAITGDLTITRGILNTFNRTLEVDGDCSIAADGKLETNVNGGKDVTLGSLTIASGGIYNATRETTTITSRTGGSGTYALENNGTFTHNNGTVKITDADNVVSLGLDSSLYNLELSGGSKKIRNNTTINNNLTLTSGDLYPHSGSLTLDVKGQTILNGGTTGQNIAFTGTMNWGSVTVNSGTLKLSSGTNNAESFRNVGGTIS